MKAENFCYWLQGFFELSDGASLRLDGTQTELVKRHLALVFIHDIDPKAGGAETQAKLNDIHSPTATDTVKAPPVIGSPDGPGGIKFRC